MIGGGLFLSDRCDVKRPIASKQAYGSKAAPADHLQSEPCHLEAQNQRGFNSITGQWLVTTTYSLHTRPQANIQEGDIITNIRLRNGQLLTEEFKVDGGSLPEYGRMMAVRVLALKKVT